MANVPVNLGDLRNPFELNRLIQYIRDLYRKSHLLQTGIVAPTSTPSNVCDMYIDTVGKKFYVAMGTSSSSDWVIQN